MTKYEVRWQVFGSREVRAESEEAAIEQVNEWLESDHDLTSQVADGWDYEATALTPVPR